MYTDVQFQWSTIATTGAVTPVFDGIGLRTCRNVTFTVETLGAVDTCVFGIEHARTSTSPFVRLGSTSYALASSAAAESAVVQFSGPLFAVRPYIISKTGATSIITVALVAV